MQASSFPKNNAESLKLDREESFDPNAERAVYVARGSNRWYPGPKMLLDPCPAQRFPNTELRVVKVEAATLSC